MRFSDEVKPVLQDQTVIWAQNASTKLYVSLEDGLLRIMTSRGELSVKPVAGNTILVEVRGLHHLVQEYEAEPPMPGREKKA